MSAAVLTAVQHIRKMRGGAQSQLLLASDGHAYVTKAKNNPQDIRVLANELLASRIARFLGLPVPDVEVIEVPESLITATPELCIDVAGVRHPWASGLQFGSRYVGGSREEGCFDYLPESLFDKVSNLHDLARALVFDKWTGNADGRQAIFTRRRSSRYNLTLIDHGYCFNAGEWSFPDSPLRGVYARNSVYQHVAGWEAFEPALSRAEKMDPDYLSLCARDIPEEWYQGDHAGLLRLIETLYQRRSRIRGLIAAFGESSRQPFPNWSTCMHASAWATSPA